MSDRSGSGINPVFAVLGAILVAGGIIGGYIWATYTGPVHAGQLVSMTAYPIHRELSTGSALGGLEGGKDVYDEEIVVTDVKVKSTTKLPLFLHDMYADVTLADGTVQHSEAASDQDYQKVFIAYPALAAARTQPIRRDTTMTPGQVLDGQMIFHFPISGQQWDSRKGLAIHIQFLHQKDLVITQGTPATQSAQGNS